MEYVNLNGIDILSALNKGKSYDQISATKSGLPNILKNFKKIAKDYNINDFIDNIYIEYSTASLMLSRKLMVGFACVDSTNNAFKHAVREKSSEVINFVRGNEISLYYHQNMLSSKSSNQQAGKPFISSFWTKTHEEQIKILNQLNIHFPTLHSENANNISTVTSNYWPIIYTQTFSQLKSFIENFKRNGTPIEDLYGCTHYCYDYFFWDGITTVLPPNHKTIYFGIPTIGTSTSNNSLNGQGGIFVYFSYNYQKIDEELLKKFIKDISISFDYIIKSYTYNLLSSVTLDSWDRTKLEAIKSAKAAIMSRNMSHNLGSHVMFYIKQKLDNAKKIYDANVLADICPAGNITVDNEHVQALSNGEIELPFLVGLGRFMNYLQERQDYIATIATDYIPANSTISFKDFIYDELKPDLRYKRHKETGSSLSETVGTQPMNLLMEYIAFSEGYNDSNKIVLKFGSFTGNNPDLEPKNEYNIRPYKKGTAALKSFEELRDFNVALPGGVIGRQAFFSIMENIIRNAAKHSGRRDDGKIEIDLDVIDPEKETWKDTRTNNCTEEQLRELYRRKSDDYHILAITDNMPHNEAAVDLNLKLLDDPYVDENYQMKDTNKGLKEIRLSAAWIRRKQLDTEIDITKEPPVISIQKIPFNNTTFAIRYIICLPKPKKIAFIVDNGLSINNEISDILRMNGCRLFCMKENKMDFSISDYDLVVLCTDIPFDLKDISSRYIPYGEKNIEIFKEFEQRLKTVDAKQAVNETMNACYKRWYESTANSFLHKLCVLDDKSMYKHKENREREILLNTTSCTDYVYYNDTIIFSTHFSGLSNKTPEEQKLYSQATFIEGITGNNSTDRLIRQTNWTEEWKYKHLAAGLLRVAIFDERIFSSISPLIKSEVPISSDSIQNFAENFWTDNYNSTIEDLYDEFSHKYSGEISDETIRLIFNRFGESLPSKGDFINEVLQFISDLSNDKYDIDKTQSYYERRIWAYDIRTGRDSNIIHIVGYDAPIKETVGIYNKNERNVTCVGTLSKKDGLYVLDMHGVPLSKNKFDIISIHQGILDKIYNAFGINSLQNETDAAAEKLKITYAIFNELSVKAQENKFKNTDKFLPQMIIHSGRSKPNSTDMPQELPFVQFAAIDHAVRDCKYTLSELLYSAHYEK